MKRITSWGVVGAFVVLAMAVASMASAGAITIAPAETGSEAKQDGSMAIRIVNDTDKPASIRVRMATRWMDIDGREAAVDTTQFTVSPSEAVIQPKGDQVVRVNWTGNAPPRREVAYNMIVEQVTPAVPGEPTAGKPVGKFNVMARFVDAIYLTPPGAKPQIVVASARPAPGPNGNPMLEVVVQNRGTAHAVLDEPVLALSSGKTKQELKGAALEPIEGENVLAGHQRRFLLPWPKDMPYTSLSGALKYSQVE